MKDNLNKTEENLKEIKFKGVKLLKAEEVLVLDGKIEVSIKDIENIKCEKKHKIEYLLIVMIAAIVATWIVKGKWYQCVGIIVVRLFFPTIVLSFEANNIKYSGEINKKMQKALEELEETSIKEN